MNLSQSFKDSFIFEGQKLRVCGNVFDPWFCGKDVAAILGYNNPQKALRDHIKLKYKTTLIHIKVNVAFTLPKNEKNTIYINEQGLYSLIFRSKLKIAELFQEWVFEKVLPSIRNKGYFVDTNITDDKIKQLQTELKHKSDELKHNEIIKQTIIY